MKIIKFQSGGKNEKREAKELNKARKRVTSEQKEKYTARVAENNSNAVYNLISQFKGSAPQISNPAVDTSKSNDYISKRSKEVNTDSPQDGDRFSGMTFSQAFSAARKMGLKNFKFNNKLYTTELAEEKPKVKKETKSDYVSGILRGQKAPVEMPKFDFERANQEAKDFMDNINKQTSMWANNANYMHSQYSKEFYPDYRGFVEYYDQYNPKTNLIDWISKGEIYNKPPLKNETSYSKYSSIGNEYTGDYLKSDFNKKKVIDNNYIQSKGIPSRYYSDTFTPAYQQGGWLSRKNPNGTKFGNFIANLLFKEDPTHHQVDSNTYTTYSKSNPFIGYPKEKRYIHNNGQTSSMVITNPGTAKADTVFYSPGYHTKNYDLYPPFTPKDIRDNNKKGKGKGSYMQKFTSPTYFPHLYQQGGSIDQVNNNEALFADFAIRLLSSLGIDENSIILGDQINPEYENVVLEALGEVNSPEFWQAYAQDPDTVMSQYLSSKNADDIEPFESQSDNPEDSENVDIELARKGTTLQRLRKYRTLPSLKK